MPKLIKNGECQTNKWQTLATPIDIQDADLTTGNYLVPLSAWLENPDIRNENIGVWLDGDTDAGQLTSTLTSASAIAVVFAAFADGRGFSLARILREDCDFTGELIAAGNYIQDQLFYLKRCGFSAFSVDDDADIDSMLISLQDFSNSYQASCDESRPLFRRR